MSTVDNETTPVAFNPLDIIEQIVSANEWPFDRYDDDEMNVGVEGSWTRYHLWFAWRPDQQALQFSCAFDLKVPHDKTQVMHSLLALMNEKMWLGHFDWLWPRRCRHSSAALLAISQSSSTTYLTCVS